MIFTGQDLHFPHHENEIAQSEACTGSQYVNYWIHNGFVRINEEKMSKSLGNFFTVRDVLKHIKPEVLRYFILASHYRSPLNYSEDNLQSANAALTRFYTALKGVEIVEIDANFASESRQAFMAAMDDDFNTPIALSVLFELVSELNQLKSTNKTEAGKYAALIIELSGLLGLLRDDPIHFLQSSVNDADGLSDDAIDQLIAARAAAKGSKDWAESDRIREELKQNGIVLEDSAAGTTWRRESSL